MRGPSSIGAASECLSTSLQLFTPKYKAKAAIDTFFVRIGDLLSTGLVFLSVQLSLTSRTLSIINLSLVVLWLLLITQIGPSYKALATAENPKERQ